ncbi:caspase, EACC1-associated type [Nodularia sp. UHCC 0506]|uniref:caspase, EACC1-associated type n=1 Tax=Nodularia sp. UHCC 0506 TaxID=3110243 RepID=UPI002B21E0A6|nr:SUMF1/EgtB/PvdO family nonheme iron enzyme [Nodularia sp. UHCC 0506]MEA5514018.1 SUMF1/EgtB/PvdO family nonheme iron enzyme [Nodularia sp. UHCC 0506]
MAKIALLIGMSEYEAGLASLPQAEKDVEAIQRVLVNPEMGGFAPGDVTVLKNPQRQEMEDAIYKLYANHHKDDLVLFYFSGHSVIVESGDFYFSTHNTKKNQGKLKTASAVAAKDVHNWINQSKSKRLVLILDCCVSGAFAQGSTAKDSGTINLQQHLGGEGRVILTASTSTQYAFESDGLDLSIYTHYLVEGIATGAADQDRDGLITADELHRYAKNKVQEASPAITPEFYPHKDGCQIFLAQSPQDDPRLNYRREVERLIDGFGKFTIPARHLLKSLRVQWKLDTDVAEAIETEVKQPYQQYQRKIQKYEEILVKKIAVEPTLSQRTLKEFKEYQQRLGLRDEDVAPIEKTIIGQQKPIAPQAISPNPANQFEFDIVKVDAQGQPINRNRGRTEYFTENLGNGVGLDMVAIPGGTFLMGSPENEPERLDWESPQHSVTIQPFFMGKFPVTQTQWAAVADFKSVNIELNPDPSHFKGANRPVECVSWDDAVEFCARLSQKTGKTYRLPSEAEWEYACRAGTTSPFYFGDTISTDLANYDGTDWVYQGTIYPGNYDQGTTGEYREQTTDVGTFPANPFGLFDMHGHIWEWCQDEWHENYHQAPADGSAWLGNDDDNQLRVLRGGSWFTNPKNCRSASRIYYYRAERDNFHSYIGLRVACSVD